MLLVFAPPEVSATVCKWVPWNTHYSYSQHSTLDIRLYGRSTLLQLTGSPRHHIRIICIFRNQIRAVHLLPPRTDSILICFNQWKLFLSRIIHAVELFIWRFVSHFSFAISFYPFLICICVFFSLFSLIVFFFFSYCFVCSGAVFYFFHSSCYPGR